ncbi:MAG: DUF1499 domain-containing protein [Bdellovibrionales bacterium]
MGANLGVNDGRLASCPKSPNCVCSFENPDDSHYIAPLKAEANPISELKSILEDLGFKIVGYEPTYLHATETSLIFRFVDDFEAYYDAGSSMLHFRSASRVGRSDFGVNRKRVEKIRERLNKVL